MIAIGAHPDDCEVKFGATAARLAAAGVAIKFVSTTNGDAGHHVLRGRELAARRYQEAQEAARRLGIAEYEILDNHDGELLPSLDARRQIISAIRRWQADVVLAPRPNDYHPDHRYTGALVQDAAYMVIVPAIVPDVPPLKANPVFVYFEDGFQKPASFRADVTVPAGEFRDAKLASLDAHVSQFYEWLPWLDGRLDEVPRDEPGRLRWLAETWAERLTSESFELCEYGRQPSGEELPGIFGV
jgi:LmbE family N-acetylglucosaminyl deacetylase